MFGNENSSLLWMWLDTENQTWGQWMITTYWIYCCGYHQDWFRRWLWVIWLLRLDLSDFKGKSKVWNPSVRSILYEKSNIKVKFHCARCSRYKTNGCQRSLEVAEVQWNGSIITHPQQMKNYRLTISKSLYFIYIYRYVHMHV